MTDCPNPDAEKAALAEALGRFAARCREIAAVDCGYWQEEYDDAEGVRLLTEADVLLADLSPAAKEILEKAQAHDAMVAELEDAQEELGRLRGILPDARLEVIAAGDPNIEVAHLADLEIRHRAALKEPA